MKRISGSRTLHDGALVSNAEIGIFHSAGADCLAVTDLWLTKGTMHSSDSGDHAFAPKPTVNRWDDCQIWPDCVE